MGRAQATITKGHEYSEYSEIVFCLFVFRRWLVGDIWWMACSISPCKKIHFFHDRKCCTYILYSNELLFEFLTSFYHREDALSWPAH